MELLIQNKMCKQNYECKQYNLHLLYYINSIIKLKNSINTQMSINHKFHNSQYLQYHNYSDSGILYHNLIYQLLKFLKNNYHNQLQNQCHHNCKKYTKDQQLYKDNIGQNKDENMNLCYINIESPHQSSMEDKWRHIHRLQYLVFLLSKTRIYRL